MPSPVYPFIFLWILGYFHLLALKKITAMNIGIELSISVTAFNLGGGEYAEVELLGAACSRWNLELSGSSTPECRIPDRIRGLLLCIVSFIAEYAIPRKNSGASFCTSILIFFSSLWSICLDPIHRTRLLTRSSFHSADLPFSQGPRVVQWWTLPFPTWICSFPDSVGELTGIMDLRAYAYV